jgi:flavin-dependent dehydrogenase
MSEAETFDVVVIGGGPAGLATAIGLAAAGFETAVVERRRPPIDRACGEGLMPDGLVELAALGIHLPLEETADFRGIRYLDGDIIAEAEFRGGAGRGIRRTVLHRAMASRAAELEVDLRWGVRCTSMEPGVVSTDAGPIRGRWIVAADGRNSMIRRSAGLDARIRRRRRVGVRRHFGLRPWTDHVEVYWSDRCEAYVTPVGRDLIGVALLNHGKRAKFDDLLLEFPQLSARLDGAEVASRDRGAGPFGQRCSSPVSGRLALVGDAAGSLDPISGEGLSVAFLEARAVVGAIIADDLSEYCSAHQAIRRTPTILTGLLSHMARHPAVRGRVIRALSSSDALFGRALAVGSRQIPARWTGRDGVLHMAWELARHGT